jgi:hypothetical protein
MKELKVMIPDEIHDQLVQQAEEAVRPLDDLVGELLAMKLQSKTQKTVGKVVEAAMRKGATNKQALALVRATFPDAETSAASVSWYRTNLRKRGEDIPTDQEARDANAFTPE